MGRMFKKAMLWELVDVQINPMSLVEIRGVSKRRKKPLVRSVEQVEAIIAKVQQPYRTMILIAQCTGLRVSEILALQWNDFDFHKSILRVTRAVVRGVVAQMKTEYSADELPLGEEFAEQLSKWREKCPPSKDGWVFPSPITGRPYELGTIQQKILRPAGKALGLPTLGWHTFRHTYRSLLDAAGAPIGVQEADAARASLNNDEHLRGRADREQARGQQQGC